MLELDRITSLGPDLGKILEGVTDQNPDTSNTPRRSDGRPPARTTATRARRTAPHARSLPRRGGY
ncbi:hypothetical protein ACIBM4_18555 [Streptomyces sp. NPDC050256]|uniref:hypothetical protein n=1 Tax=Streptomyces sp. NPDC050256 TaxID=3365607 RepID=UPI00378ED7F5